MKNVKKILIGFVLSMFVLSLGAQTGAGNILIGGSSNLGISAYTDKYKTDDGDGTDGKGVNINLAPQAGYFVIDGLAVGLRVDLNFSSFKEDGAEDASSFTGLTLAPFARYYYGDSKIKPFGEVAVGFGSYSIKSAFDGDKDKTGVFVYQFKLGAAFFVNDNVSIDLGLGYSAYSEKAKEDNDINERTITSGIGFDVGISIIL